VFGGELPAASAVIEEADAIAIATGTTPLAYARLLLGAWRGVEAEAIDAGLAASSAQGEGAVVAIVGYGTAVLNNALGRYETAFDAASHSAGEGDYGYASASLPELVEAACRSGKPEAAAAALRRLEERTRAAGTDWALGVLARSRALLDGDEALYREAVERLERTRVRSELARARLVYGEWLRREDRRVDAREQLRAAHEEFRRAGAEGFAERARRELAATGESIPRRTAPTRDVLTPQETQIARMARDGQTNPEIGAQLFISPRTVEYHLRKVFTKLGIGSRRELRAALGTGHPGRAD
jgi:DNA-binding CsgD family transcriptional regulator